MVRGSSARLKLIMKKSEVITYYNDPKSKATHCQILLSSGERVLVHIAKTTWGAPPYESHLKIWKMIFFGMIPIKAIHKAVFFDLEPSFLDIDSVKKIILSCASIKDIEHLVKERSLHNTFKFSKMEI